ncbi:hypothetical protein ACOMHN_064605 [Nucella lapillus]
MDDQKYREVVHFLSSTEKKYPEYMYSMSDERKRSVVKSNFRQFAASYKLKSAVLVHSKTEKEVIQKSRVNAILQACHDNPTTGGHFGRDKTMLKITERFHWKGMKKDVRDYIKNCKKCFAVNVKMASEAPPLNSISVPKKVWSLVGIDIIGPLQETAKGNKYIVAITDHFSKCHSGNRDYCVHQKQQTNPQNGSEDGTEMDWSLHCRKSLDKGRVVLKNEKTNTVLKNTYHLANLKVYPCSEITSKTNKDQEGATLPPRGVSAVRDGSKEPLPKRWKEMDCFKPISVDQRKTLVEALGLEVSKIIALGKYSELTQPRRLHRTKGDGNCYFRSISFVLTSSEDQHLKVRDRVVRHMSLIPIAEKIKAYSGQETAEYISASRMEDMGTWATDIEVVATANLLGCDIIVHSKYGEEMRWLRYPASFSLRQKTDTAIYLENRSDHFNVVLSVA